MTLEKNLNEMGLWTLHIDESSNFKCSEMGIILTSPNGDKLEQPIRCGFWATNNEVEYEALIAGLAKDLGMKRLHVNNDSQLIFNQMKDMY